MPTSPDDAYRISQHASAILSTIRAANDVKSLNSTYASWLDWARQEGVCSQIRDHIASARGEEEARLRRSEKDRQTSINNRIVGEGK
jgi:hypothetical protein